MKKNFFAALAAAAMLCCTLAAPVSAAEEVTFQMGDVNLDGSVDPTDAILIMKDFLELTVGYTGILTSEQRQIGNLDGKVCQSTSTLGGLITFETEADPVDALLILQYFVANVANPDITMEDAIGRSPQFSEELEEFAKKHKFVWDEANYKYTIVER